VCSILVRSTTCLSHPCTLPLAMESRSTVCHPRATLRRSGLSGLLAARCLLPQRAIAGRTLRTGSTASVMPCLTVRITPGPGPRSASCHRLGLPQVRLTTPRTRLNLTTLQCGAMALGAAAAIVRSPMTATACVVPTAFSQLLARLHPKKKEIFFSSIAKALQYSLVLRIPLGLWNSFASFFLFLVNGRHSSALHCRFFYGISSAWIKVKITRHADPGQHYFCPSYNLVDFDRLSQHPNYFFLFRLATLLLRARRRQLISACHCLFKTLMTQYPSYSRGSKFDTFSFVCNKN
jgi:hypothetical protein